MHRFTSTPAALAVLIAGAGVLASAQAASAATANGARPGPGVILGCAPVERVFVSESGSPTYGSWGTAVGKYNDSTVTSNLSYSLSRTTSRSTSWTTGGGASVDFGILQIEAKTSYDVTKSVASTVNVTDLLAVPGKRYGYDQAKVEFRTFWIREVTTRSDCSTYVSTDYGTLKAITTAPFFSSCVSTVACTPKP